LKPNAVSVFLSGPLGRKKMHTLYRAWQINTTNKMHTLSQGMADKHQQNALIVQSMTYKHEQNAHIVQGVADKHDEQNAHIVQSVAVKHDNF
jgi:hypothetical protein